MAKRYLTISDLTGQPVDDDNQVVTIAVLEHPTLDHPVQLDAAQDEVKDLADTGKDFVLLELISDGGDKRERLVLELGEFERVINGDAQEVLDNAEPYTVGPQGAPQQERRGRGRPRSSGRPPALKADRLDYKAPENAGLVHRGRITEEEKALVQADLDRANANRQREGQPEIDLTNAKVVGKYGLYKHAEKAGVIPK